MNKHQTITTDTKAAGLISNQKVVHAKLAIGAVNDPLGKEADDMADHVMRMPEDGLIQHKLNGDEEDNIQRKPGSTFIQRKCASCEEEDKLQRKPLGSFIQKKGNQGGVMATDSVIKGINSSRGNGQSLPANSKTFMESRFGADFNGVKIHSDSIATNLSRSLNAKAFTVGNDIYFNQGQFSPGTESGKRLLAHELSHVGQQTSRNNSFHSIQRKKNKEESSTIPFEVHVTEKMTTEEFRKAAMIQIFGKLLDNVNWKNSKESYIPSSSPYTVNVGIRLLKTYRSSNAQERGIKVDADGNISGAGERAKSFQSEPESNTKTELINEIDRKYYKALGDKSKAEIKSGEQAKAELWRTIRDEVLFQHEYIINLPPQVKKLIKIGINGKNLTPADYDEIFRIAKKIEGMPPGLVNDYASKVTGSTTDFTSFETSLDNYLVQIADRKKQSQDREKVQTRLLGLDEVYKKYRQYKTALLSETLATSASAAAAHSGGGVSINLGPRASSLIGNDLRKQLIKHDFASITEFEKYIKQFEQAFEKEAVNIVTDLLEKYEGKLYQESERYKNPAELKLLHQLLGSVRTSYAEFETNSAIWNDYVKTKDQHRIPGQGHIQPKHNLSEATEARTIAETAKASAQTKVEALSDQYPIFQEKELALDKRIDKVALSKANENELGSLLQLQIQNRKKDITEAISDINETPELIYKMDKLMPHFYVQQGIRTGSIHDMIIQDKLKSDAILKIIKGIGLAIVAIALAVVSLGSATPAIIAAGAAITGAGLGAYMALEEYHEYTQQKNLADVGLSNDPSIIWLVLAVAGAGLDMAAAVKAVKALSPLAKTFNTSGDLNQFAKSVRALEKANEIDAKIANAVEKAADARKGLSEASKELTKVLSGKLYSFPGPLADPDVYKAVVKMAWKAIETKLYDAHKFIEELKLARLKAGLGDLNPEELAKAKQAWEEAQKMKSVAEESNLHQLELIPIGSRVHPNVPPYGGDKVQGVFKFGEADVPLISGETGPGKWLIENLPGGKGSGLTRAWTHVEGHAAGIMQKHGLKEAELFINKIPCDMGRANCQAVISKLLPENSKLTVHFLKPDGTVGSGIFEAGVAGFKILIP